MPISRLGYVNNGTKKEFPVISALPREMTMAEFALLSDEEKMGDIIVTDYPVNEESDYVEVTADGVKTYSTLLDELFALVDFDRVNQKSCVAIHSQYGDEFQFVASFSTSGIYTGNSNVNTNGINNGGLCILASGSTYYLYRNGSNSNASSLKLNSGGYIRLYYNYAHTFDFNTKAENCIYGNETVKDALDDVIGDGTFTTPTIYNGRLSNITNGYIEKNGVVYVQMTITVSFDGAVQPYDTIATNYMPIPKGNNVFLNCVRADDGYAPMDFSYRVRASDGMSSLLNTTGYAYSPNGKSFFVCGSYLKA